MNTIITIFKTIKNWKIQNALHKTLKEPAVIRWRGLNISVNSVRINDQIIREIITRSLNKKLKVKSFQILL